MRASEPTIFVVDDDKATRDSMRWLLESVGFAVETFGSAEDFLRVCSPDWAGCLVLDVRMPGMSGLGLQRELADRDITLPIIFITAHGTVPLAAQAFKGGALDFIEKPFGDQTLLDHVRRALAVDRRRRQWRQTHDAAVERLAELTQRQLEVLDRLVEGKPNKVIAAEMGVSERTVEAHRGDVMKKLRVGSIAELVQLVLLAKEGEPDVPTRS